MAALAGTIVAFLTPFFLPFVLFYLVPIGYALWQSFRVVRRSGGQYGTSYTTFGGFEQYVEVFQNDEFWSSIGRIGLFGIVQVPVMLFTALVMALLLDTHLLKLKGFFRTAAFMPYAVPGVIAAIMWSYLYSPQLSPVVDLLNHIGLDPDFLGPGAVLWSAANISTWLWTGYNMLIMFSALQSIPQELYEAARIDGAGNWTIAWRIKVPIIAPSIVMTTVFSIIGTLQLYSSSGAASDLLEHLQYVHPEHAGVHRGRREQLPAGRGHFGGHRRHHVRLELRVHATDLQEGGTVNNRPPVQESRVSRTAVMALMLVLAIYFLLPLYFLIVAATKPQGDLASTNGLTFSNFQLFDNLHTLFTFNDGIFARWILNTVIYAVLGAAVGTLISALCGYALAKFRFRGREFLFSVILGGVLVPSTALALPLFLLFSEVGLVNTYFAVFLPSIVSPFGVYLARIFANAAVPQELIESARLDGAA